MNALDAVAARIAALPRPARVAVDGVTAAGRTTIAEALALLLPPPIVRVTLDDFHRPPPHEYYPSSFDLPRFRRSVLELGAELVIADGVFLLHPELRDLWDLTIFLSVDRTVALERGILRDEQRLENARDRYASRYVPGESRYLEDVAPEALADIVLDTTDLDRPLLRR